ncbi:Ig-like domain-containing protein [Corallococcus sp. AS-1-12]|uniref:Ig-like domain-containing protein n=1 Tax=Corallococcus sp. AS-1-12 TaxID=2874598 RepID=UPI001CBAAB13|nr:Ig-like domain-containing protein [Corallococcus sp. AS-1-12]MBZ4333145.1 Ig-like domain-containing protein [Corallococcus sp. AS-1-12]
MPNLKHLLLLSCIGLSPACIDVPPLDDPPKEDPRSTPDADFTFTATPAQEQVLPGGTLDCGVQLAWTEAAGGAVTWSLVSPPAGIELQSYTLPKGETRATLSIRVGAGTVPGAYTLTLQGKSGSVTKQATLSVTVGKPGVLVVNWVVPTPGQAYTRGPLLLQFTVEGGAAEQVEILKNATVLVKPTGSPYSFTWDTTSEAEGTYQLSIRATRGGAVFTSAPRTVIVDRTAPTVASFLPAKDAATVGVHDSIQVTFSEPMNPLSVTEAAVGLKTGTGDTIAKSVALSADSKTLTVTPLSALTTPSTVQVDLSAAASALTDLAGNGVVSAPAWSFAVPTWLPLGGAISAEGGATPANEVVLKLDLEDQPVIAWTESDGTARNVYVSRWTGTSWIILGGALNGLGAAGTDAGHPTLVIDSSNRPIVAWHESAGNGQIKSIFSRRWNGTTWETLPSLTLPFYEGYEQLNLPTLGLEGTGALSLYANYANEGEATVRHYRLTSGAASWSLSTLPTPSGYARAQSPTALISGTQTFAAYSIFDFNGEGDGIRGIAVSENDGFPLGNRLLGTAAMSPALSIDGNGRPWIAWVESPSSQPSSDGQVYWARWEGNVWSAPSLVSVSSTGNSAPVMSMKKGVPHAIAWSGIIASERYILLNRWISNQWQSIGYPLTALPGTSTPATSPSLELRATGTPIVAFIEEAASSASVYTFRLND